MTPRFCAVIAARRVSPASMACDAGLEVQRLGLIEVALLLIDVALDVDRVPDRGGVARELADGDRGLEAIEGGVDVGVELIGAPDPAQQRRRHACRPARA